VRWHPEDLQSADLKRKSKNKAIDDSRLCARSRSFAYVTTATALASAVGSLYTVNVYTAGALPRIRLNYHGKISTALW